MAGDCSNCDRSREFAARIDAIDKRQDRTDDVLDKLWSRTEEIRGTVTQIHMGVVRLEDRKLPCERHTARLEALEAAEVQRVADAKAAAKQHRRSSAKWMTAAGIGGAFLTEAFGPLFEWIKTKFGG
jgi:hypothetical protein